MSLFPFFAAAPNDRGYGHLAVCGSVRCRTATRRMRAQNLLSARQPANEHRRVLGGRSLRQLVEQTSTEKNEQNHANHNSVA